MRMPRAWNSRTRSTLPSKISPPSTDSRIFTLPASASSGESTFSQPSVFARRSKAAYSAIALSYG